MLANAQPRTTKPGRKGISPELRARVVHTYQYEVEKRGERGVYKRVAAHYRKPDGTLYTDEWARLIVVAWKKDNEAKVAAIPDPEPGEDLSYVAPPGAAAHQAMLAMDHWRLRVAQQRRDREAAAFLATFNTTIDRLMVGLTALDKEIERQKIPDGADPELLAYIAYVNQQAKELAIKRWEEYQYQVFERSVPTPDLLPTHQLSPGTWLLLLAGLVTVLALLVANLWGFWHGLGVGGMALVLFAIAGVVCRWERELIE